MGGIYLQVAQGATLDRSLRANDYFGGATSYLPTDVLTGRIWPGEQTPVELPFTPTWIDATTGTFRVLLHPADTSPLIEGLHRIECRATRGLDSFVILDTSLEVTVVPGGVATTITTYCSYEDLLDIAPWIRQVQMLEVAQAGFPEERQRAREWLDWIILNNYRGSSVGLFEGHSTLAFAWGGGVGWRRSQGPSLTLVIYLAQDKLLLRPQIVRVAAMHAISLIGMKQIGINNIYAGYGQFYRDLSERELTGITAEIDLNGNGIGELFINLGSTNTLFT